MLDKDAQRARLLANPPPTLAEKVAATIGKNRLLSAKEVADALGRTEQAISGWRKAGRVDKAHLKTLARLSGLPLHWWLPGEDEEQDALEVRNWPFPSIPEKAVRGLGDADLRRLEGAIALAIAQLNLKMDVAPAPAVPKMKPQPIVLPVEQAANDPGYVAIPLKKIKIRAGVAGFSLDQTGNGTAGAIYVSREWLKRKGFVAEKLFATRVGGLSMWPRVDEGDLVLINTADTDRRNGHVYGFNHEGQFVLKRLKKQLNRWYLTSDNPDKTQFPPIHADEGTFMIGRAVLLQAEEI